MPDAKTTMAQYFSRFGTEAMERGDPDQRNSRSILEGMADDVAILSVGPLFLPGTPGSLPWGMRPWPVLPMKLVSKVSHVVEQAVTLADTVTMNHRETMPKLWTGLEDMKFSLLLYRIKAAQSEVRRWRRSQTCG